MTGPEHDRKAEELARLAARHPDSSDAPVLAQLATAYATLALAAATRDAGIPRGKVLADQCRTAESAHGRQCVKAAGHDAGHDFGDGDD
ncbi:hypothetical protein [Streptomyces xantholiticus]|uniref:hypothetical protein n=1 Tax=Streptomyces xantholiticus TaxID=68285 RepID=UPI001678A008|nr:hypothetical protein [Streptomyces xantholiticus]GGW41083.1 hypothetical protein GCM10010381_27390 [Streptomyces xantholiticus]